MQDTDNYCALPATGGDMLYFDEDQHRALMAEAMALRESGAMLARALRVACPVVALHGEYDPHPAQGIRAPLEGRLSAFRITVLPRCGHDPWKEMYAREAFFDLLQAEMAGER